MSTEVSDEFTGEIEGEDLSEFDESDFLNAEEVTRLVKLGQE